ncbi:calcineurin-like phosphoesterase C-terminal domain-containing protein [Arthrobacter sp. MPF02]|uniref:calcineurin-like phosphoesterase C-terminal domain-containing protein n=1 Tax=Arthrobacter sp. MPF02 TaxID=3388492 RepID=UPI003984D3D5
MATASPARGRTCDGGNPLRGPAPGGVPPSCLSGTLPEWLHDDLANTTWLTTNFWMGGTGSTVKVQLDGGQTVEAVRTQQMQGEGQLAGAEWSDPVAVQEQLVHGGSLADRMMHLWRFQLPADLAAGLSKSMSIAGRPAAQGAAAPAR